jgi:hypothetical protein
MAYVVGTDADEMHFSADGIAYAPAGRRHAVDTDSPLYSAESLVAYAVCGHAVRAWNDQLLDVETAGVDLHDECAARARSA